MMGEFPHSCLVFAMSRRDYRKIEFVFPSLPSFFREEYWDELVLQCCVVSASTAVLGFPSPLPCRAILRCPRVDRLPDASLR